MLERLRAHLEESDLIPRGSRVLAGYSGGADSTCMLHLLHRLGVDAVAAHLHHGQRAEADREMALCEAFCTELDLPFVGGRADVPRLAADRGVGLEEAGRIARYGFFEQAAAQTGCDRIATAHTADDHVETVLLNLARGCGLNGLAGLRERRGEIVRPMRVFTREETRAYCDAEGLWFHDDPANADVEFARARVRHRILPEFRALNPSFAAAVDRLSRLAMEEDGFLNGMAAAALEQSELPLNGPLGFLTRDCEVAFRRQALLGLPRVLLRRSLRLAMEALGGEVGFDLATALVDGLAGQPSGAVTAGGGQVVAEWDAEGVLFRQLQPDAPFRHPLEVPGETESLEFGWRIEAHAADPSDFGRPRRSLDVMLDAGMLKGALHFRSAEPGDAIVPLGMVGRRKLSDIFQEAELTQAARRRLPIVCDMVGPIWVPSLCLADRVRVSPDTRRGLRLALGPVENPSV